MASERKIRGLKNRKRSIISSFSSICNFVNNYQAERDAVEVPVRLEHLSVLWNEYNNVQVELDAEEVDEKVIEAGLLERAEIEKTYYRVKGKLLSFIPQPSQAPQPPPAAIPPSQVTQVRLPSVTLPVFDGDLREWQNFHDLFVALVHSSSELPTIQKYHYLRAALHGDALNVIRTIPICSDQYFVAWQTLIEHYHNTRRLKHITVRSLFDYPAMQRESAADLHALLEHFEVTVRIMQQQGEQTEHWDSLLMHLLSSRLDPITRRDWEEYAETNQCEKFQQLIDFLQRRVGVLQTLAVESNTGPPPPRHCK